MKNSINIIGYVAAFIIVLGTIFKIEHWPGASIFIVVGSSFLSFFYLPVFISYKLNETTKGEHNTINYLGAFCGSAFHLGILFKIMHWPGAGILLVISSVLFSCVFLPLFASVKMKNNPELRAMYATGAIALAMLTLGLLFKIQRWPGRPILFLGGFAFLFFGYLPMYIKSYKNSVEQKTKSLGSAFFISLTAIVIVLSLSGSSNQILNSFGMMDMRINESAENLKEKSENLFSGTQSEKVMLVKQQADDLVNYIRNLRKEIIMAVDNLPEEVADTISFFEIGGKENYDIPSRIMIGRDSDKPDGKAVDLKLKIDKFRTALAEIPGVGNSIPGTGEVDLGWGQKLPWELGNFYHMPTASVITYLSKLQEDVRMAEFETISYLNAHPDSIIIK